MANRLSRILLLAGAASCLAWGEGMPAPPDRDAPTVLAAPAARAAADLDFGDDIPPPQPTPRLPRGGAAGPVLAAEPASRAWIYWTLGLFAAAGGAWLAHDALDASGAPKRTTEVFTDGAP